VRLGVARGDGNDGLVELGTAERRQIVEKAGVVQLLTHSHGVITSNTDRVHSSPKAPCLDEEEHGVYIVHWWLAFAKLKESPDFEDSDTRSRNILICDIQMTRYSLKRKIDVWQSLLQPGTFSDPWTRKPAAFEPCRIPGTVHWHAIVEPQHLCCKKLDVVGLATSGRRRSGRARTRKNKRNAEQDRVQSSHCHLPIRKPTFAAGCFNGELQYNKFSILSTVFVQNN